MLDIGSWEFLIVIVIALIVVGPKELPALVRTVSQWVRRARELAREFQGGLEDMAREAELDKVKDSLQTEIDPEGVVNTIKRDIEDEIQDEWPDDDTPLDLRDAERVEDEASEAETVEPAEAETVEPADRDRRARRSRDRRARRSRDHRARRSRDRRDRRNRDRRTSRRRRRRARSGR